MSYIPVDSLVQHMTPEQRDFVAMFYSRFDISTSPLSKKIVNVEPLFYQGVIAGSEFATPSSNFLYIALDLSFDKNAIPLPAQVHVDLINENGVISYREEFQRVNNGLTIIGNNVRLKSSYFWFLQPSADNPYVRMKFIGYRVTLLQSFVPAILFDGNTVAWFKYNTLIKDGANRVSQWTDVSGLNHHLLQAVGANQPLWVANDGILFDGANDNMKCVGFPLIQPELIYFCGKQITYTANDYIFDGNAQNLGAIQQFPASPQVIIYAGGTFPANPNLAINTLSIVQACYNTAGTGGFLQVNQTAQTAGSNGLSNMNGFTLGAAGNLGFPSNIQAKEIIIRKIEDTAPNRFLVRTYLKIINNVP